jgi:hypothetical protein
VGWNAEIDKEIAYFRTRSGMIKFLMPINVGFLDPPVAKLYHKAFDKGWEKLSGRDDQMRVAEASATVKKKGLE